MRHITVEKCPLWEGGIQTFNLTLVEENKIQGTMYITHKVISLNEAEAIEMKEQLTKALKQKVILHEPKTRTDVKRKKAGKIPREPEPGRIEASTQVHTQL